MSLEGFRIIKFNVTILSHPAALTKVSFAIVSLEVYVTPFVQVYETQDEILSVEVLVKLIVKFNVTILSHPAALTKVSFAIVSLEVYVTPFVQVYDWHSEIVSVEVLVKHTE